MAEAAEASAEASIEASAVDRPPVSLASARLLRRFHPITAGMHSLNAVFLLIDTFLNSMPFPWFRMTYFVFWSCIYVTFQWTLHACGFTWWPYPFLELDTPWSPLWYLGIALIHVPCYVSYWLIVKAKSYFCPKFFPSAFARTF